MKLQWQVTLDINGAGATSNAEKAHSLYVVRIFPNAESCLRLVRALTVERHEAWLEDHRYLNMDLLKEHKKETLRQAA
ncbi:transposase [Bradyrhizobium campsiandrae]|uniref:transposase n=1 Tax=Bradyrhizobium campsiandrae TaxID=1729892 RepID=UPI0024BF743C|nr:transposase [Bradyrhizobium campsiandrae]